MESVLHTTYLPFLLAVFLAGCFEGAPHSNPLDPRGGEFENAVLVTGITTGFYAPFLPLRDVEVRLMPGAYQAVSDADGRFSINGVPAGTYRYTAQKDGYSTIEDSITVTLDAPAVLDVRLGGLPSIDNVVLKTFHLSRWWPPPVNQYWIDVEVEASDTDGIADLEQVMLEIPAFDLAYPLTPTGAPQQFTTRLREEDLGVPVPSILGHDIHVRAMDRAGFEGGLVSDRIVRVINESAVALAPAELALISNGLPEYRWTGVTLPFPFTYQINVLRVEANIQTRTQTITGVPGDHLSFQATEALPAGEYIWSVSIVDEFGNKSRSREASFRVP